MNIKNKEIYSEVYQVLILLGNEYIDKLPKSLFNTIKEKREISYNPQYIENMPLNRQNVKKETIAIIALLHLNYWCESDNEKMELKLILKNNEDKYQEELRNKYNPEDVFKGHYQKREIQDNIAKNQISMIEYKEPLLKRLITKIKSIFYKD